MGNSEGTSGRGNFASALHRENGPPLPPEGRAFAGALAVADLIDEYRLQIPPLVLGQGKALFAQLPESRHLNLVQAIPFPSGIVVHIYQPQRS